MLVGRRKGRRRGAQNPDDFNSAQVVLKVTALRRAVTELLSCPVQDPMELVDAMEETLDFMDECLGDLYDELDE